MPDKHPIFVEIGQKRTFAGSLEWPGWCRGGKDQGSALQALLDYAARFSQIAEIAGLDFALPSSREDFDPKEVVEGNATTSFGAPAIILKADRQPAAAGDYQKWRKLLTSSWAALDGIIQSAAGKQLRKGPRGGGRDLEGILSHLVEGDLAYLRKAAVSYRGAGSQDQVADLLAIRSLILEVLETAERQGLPEHGPRGGEIWPIRFFVRRVVWHTLDHAWEIEDRIQGS